MKNGDPKWDRRFLFRDEFLDVEVQLELVRMGAQTQGVDILALEVDVHVDEVFGEDAANGKEVVVGFESVEDFFQRTGDGGNAFLLFGLEFVEVFVEGVAGLDLVDDTVETSQQLGGQREVDVAGDVGGAELDTLGLGRLGVERDADSRGAVALAIQQVDRGFVTGNQTMERVGRGVGESQKRGSVLEDATDVPASGVGELGVAVLVEHQGLAVFPDRLVTVHAGAVVAEDGLGHEGGGEAVLVRHVLDDVLVQHHAVAHFGELAEGDADFALAARSDFVVMQVDFDTGVFEVTDDVVADFGQAVDGGSRDIAALVTGATTRVPFAGVEIEGLIAVVPVAFDTLDFVAGEVAVDAAGSAVATERNAVEEEELGFRSEVGGVGDAGRFHVFDGFLNDVAGVTRVGFAGERVQDVGENRQRGGVVNRVDDGGRDVGHEQHVRLVDGLETANGRAVEANAVSEEVLGEGGFRRVSQVLQIAEKSDEFKVNELNARFLGHCDDRLNVCHEINFSYEIRCLKWRSI